MARTFQSILSYYRHRTSRRFFVFSALACSWLACTSQGTLREARFSQLHEDCGKRFQHDRQVQPERNVFRIKDVHLDHFGERSFVLAIHLPVSSKARRSVDPFLLPSLIALEFIGCARARTDQAHFSAKHIEELRQFIQSGRSQYATTRNDAGITRSVELCHRTVGMDKLLEMTFVALRLDIDLHRPELQDHEASSSKANALLPKEDRTGGGDLNPECDANQNRQPNGQTQ